MLYWLLGIPVNDRGENTSLRLRWLARPEGEFALLLAISILAVVVAVWFLYRWEASRIPARGRVLLVGPRLLAMGTVVAMLLEPVAVLSTRIDTPSNLLVLVDRSISMDLHDTWDDTETADSVVKALDIDGGQATLQRLSRRALIDKVLESNSFQQLSDQGGRLVRIHAFAEQLDLQENARMGIGMDDDIMAHESNSTSKSDEGNSRGRLTGRTTAIGSSVRQAILAYQGMPLSGILVVSDGQSNSGESLQAVAELASSRQVTVAALAVGTQRGPRNASIIKLDTNSIAFVGDRSSASVLVQSQGMSGTNATVVLEQSRAETDWHEIGRQDLEFDEDGTIHELDFQFVEESPGTIHLRARLESESRELTDDDNIGVAEVRLVPPGLRVLFVAGSTFPEVQFLRNALRRDRAVDLSTWNQSADATYEHPGDTPIRRLPTDQDELRQYDCVVLYDPDPEKWPANFSELLTQFVSYDGGGLIYVAGEMQTERSFSSQADPRMSWLKLLPVVREPGLFQSRVKVRISARDAWRLLITDVGRRHPVFQFAPRKEENELIIGSLPGMYWHFPVTRAKAGATVLARHGDPRMRNEFGAEVLLATHQVGPGRVFFVGFDSTYRWRYIDEQAFDGFWARMIEHAGRAKQLGGGYPFRLRTDRLTYRPGDEVRLTATYRDPSRTPTATAGIEAEVEHAEDRPTHLSLEPGLRDGQYEARFTVEQPGPYLIQAWLGEPGGGRAVRTVSQQITVDFPNVEYDKPNLDRSRLELLTASTGGQVLELFELDKLAKLFPVTRVSKLIEHRSEMWNAPLIYGLFVVALTCEWLLRKQYQLT